MARPTASSIASSLRRDIERGILRQHDRLPSARDMAQDLGVARNTLRAAIARLEEQGYLETRRSSGTFVIYKAPEETEDVIYATTPLELMDARFALEPHICRLCVLHGRPANFVRLAELCTEMEDTVDDPERFSWADTAFHQVLAETTGNSLLIRMIKQFNEVRIKDDWTRMRHLTLDPGQIRLYNEQHRAILNSIQAREPETAAQMMKTHLESARQSLTRVAAT